MKRSLRLLIPLLLAAGAAYYWWTASRPVPLVLTGIVTTNDVVVSPQIAGRIEQLNVSEGDQVKAGQMIAVLDSGELEQEEAYYSAGAATASSQVAESEAALRYQARQVTDQIRQAEANLAATEAQQMAARAELENSKVTLDRAERMSKEGVVAQQELDQAKTAYQVAQSKIDSLAKQIDAQHAAVELARSNADQVSIRRSQLQANQKQQAAAAAQHAKAGVRLGYTELRAPIDAVVDVRAARIGEVVTPGQPVVTLINPDDLWVRANVEETYIDRVRVGDKLKVRLPSGEEREGTVFYRGVEAAFATQRDVSRTKRDIKTFEIRLRVDNKDRRLAVGMTAYVELPVRAG
jgi:multidrug resistance efflux pump